MAGPAAEAYIIMRADGTLLPRDVKSFAKDAGEETGEQFADGFEEEWSKASEKSMKDFEKRIGKALETSDFDGFRQKGESIDKMFVRLGETLEDLNREGKLSDRVFEGFFEHFDEYMNISATNEQVKAYTTYSDAARKSEEKRAASVTNLGRKMEDLSVRQREWMDRQIEMAELSGDWDPFIKKMGGAEKALERLGARTDETRRANVAYGDSMDHLEESLIDWIDVAKKRQADEEATRAQTEASEKQRKATEDLAKASQKASEKAVADRERLIRSNSTLQRDLDKLKGASDRALDALIVKSRTTGSWSELNHHVNDAADTIDHVRTRSERLEATTDAVSQRLRVLRDSAALTEEDFRDLTDAFAEYERQQRRIIDTMDETTLQQERARVIHESVNRTVSEGHKGRDDFILQLGNMGDRTGRMFGKDGRSDVLHYFGSLVGGIAKFALQAPAKVFGVASDGVKVFTKSFQQLTTEVGKGGAGMSKMPAMFSSLGSAASAMAPAVASAALAIIGVSAVAGALASFISLLVGNLVILGQTLYLSVAAPLLALVPAIAGFGAGALIAGGAIYKWSQQSSAFKSAMSGISDELDKLAKRITPAMDGLSRLFGKAGQSMVQSFSGAVTRVLSDLYKKLDDPAMDKFYRAWNESMPRAFESLGKAASSFITGLTAFFVPILPYAERLAEAIRRAADRFSEWARSAKGQNAIADWMSTAWQVAKDLWAGLKDIFVGLRNIFGLATGSGGNFAEWVRGIGERFKEWTESEEGREAIKQWFEDAEDLAKDFKFIVEQVAKAFDALDSPEGRGMLKAFMGFIKFIAFNGYLAAEAMNAVNVAVTKWWDWWSGNVKDAFEDFMEMWEKLWEGDLLGAVESGLDMITVPLRSFTPWDSLREAGTAIKDTVGGWFEDIDWGQIWQGVKDGISQQFNFLPPWLKEKGKELFDKFIEAIKERLGIASPSQVMIDLMREVGNGILLGLQAIPGIIMGAVGTLFQPLIDKAMALPGQVMGALSSLGSTIGTAFSTVTSTIGTAVSGWWATISTNLSTWGMNAWGALQGFGSSIGSALSGVASNIGTAVSGWWTTISSNLMTWGTRAWGALQGFGSSIGSTLSGVASTIGSAVSGWWSGIGSTLSGWGGRARSALSSFGSTVTSTVRSAGSKLGTTVSGWWGSIGSTLSGFGGKAKSALSNFGSNVRSAFQSAKTAASDKAGELVSSARGKLAEMGGKAKSALSNLGSSVKSRFDSAKTSASSAAGSLVSSARGKLAEMGGKASSALSNLSSKVKSRFNTAKSNATSTASSLVTSARGKLAQMGSKASSALSNLSSRVKSRFTSAKSSATSTASSLVSSARGKLAQMGSRASSALSNLAGSVRSRFNSAKSTATTIARSMVSSARSILSGMAGAMRSALSGVTDAIKRPFQSAKDAVDRIIGQIRDLASRAKSIGGGLRGKIPGFATGGTVFGSQIARVGETGAEAIVPLSRPLHQVDPSVRWLSAIAQGKGGGGGGGTNIAPGAIQIVSPYANPELVANRVLDDLVSNL